MIAAEPTIDEQRRIEALRQYGVLDTPPDQALDDLTALAAQLCGVPMSAISLVDTGRQWFKAQVGLEIVESPRNVSFCGHAVHRRDVLVVPDANKDERFAGNPLVTSGPGICFYAGAPLVTPANAVLGTLCVMDHVPRTLRPEQEQILLILAHQVMTHFELQRHSRELVASEERLHIVTNNTLVGLAILNQDRRYVYINNAYADILQSPLVEIVGQRVSDVIPGISDDQIRPQLDRAFAGERVVFELRKTGDGSDRHFEVRYEPTTVDGARTGLLMVLTEITERKKAEIASLLLAAIVEWSDDAIIGKDLNSIITSWNLGAEKTFSYTADEMVGTSMRRLIPADRQAEEGEIVEKVISGESLSHFETQRQAKDGRRIDVSVTASPKKDAAGRVIGVSNVARDITERKRIEQRLTLLDTCVSNLNDIVLVTESGSIDEPGPRILFVNDTFERLTGYSPAETIGRSPRFLQGEKTDLVILAEIREAPGFRKPIRRTLIAYGKDGAEHCMDIDIVPILDAVGKCTHFAAIARDITNAEKAEARYRTLFDYAPDGILIADSESYYIDANASMCQMLGYTREELIGLHASAIVSQIDTVQIAPAIRDIKAKADYHREWQFRRRDGSFFRAEVIATLLPDGNLLGMIRDVTERNRAQERIAEQAALLDKAQDAILVRAINGSILFWNKGAERIYGWTSQEAIGRPVGELLYTNPNTFEDLNRLTIDTGKWHGEVQQVTQDEREITVEARWTLIYNDEGQPKSILSINTDITAKKKIEAQFMRAQRMESIGTLAGGIAHDLNNILTPIMMSVDMLKALTDHPRAHAILETLAISAKRGADIVRQVLSFARGVKSERIEIQPKDLFEDLEKIIKGTFPKDIRVEFAISDKTWSLLGDPTQIHQVLLNLCVNARDAMPDGGRLFIGVENCILDEQYAAMNIEARPGRYIRISVTDSGAGMSPEVMDKIFEPFFSTKDVNKGTGLGLSTVMSIVKSHNGIVNVYSELGRSTTFRIHLPAVETTPGGAREQSEPIVLPRGHGETILVVDDEISILDITSQTLQAFGYRVLTATDGADAVAVFARHMDEIDVVITDMMMPIMEGPTTIRALMRIDPTVKIIATSGLDANGGTAKMTGAGAKYF